MRTMNGRGRSTFREALRRMLLPFLAVKLLLLVGLVLKDAVGQGEHGWVPMPEATRIQEAWIGASISGDGQWYMRLAEEGYERVAWDSEGQHNWAYFPVYPLFLNLIGRDVVTALVASSIFAFAGYVFLRMYLARYFDPASADSAVVFMMFFPFANALGTMRPEAMIFMCWSAALMAWSSGRKNLAIWVSALAVALKPEGLAILAYFFVDELLAIRKEGFKPWRLLRLVIPILPLLAFSLYIYAITGHPLAWAKVQASWGSEFLVQPWRQTLELLESPMVVGRWGWDLTFVNVLCSLVGIVVTVAAALRRDSWPAAAFLAAVLLLSFLNFGYWQMGRHLAIAPTVAVGFALLPASVRIALQPVMVGMGAMTLLMFAMGLRFAFA